MTKDKKSDWRKDLGVKCQVQMRIIPAVAQASEKGSEPLVQSVEALDNEIQCGSLLSLPHLCGFKMVHAPWRSFHSAAERAKGANVLPSSS